MFGVSAGKTLCRDDFPSQAGCELMYSSTQSALKCPLKDRTMKKTSAAFCSKTIVYELKNLKIKDKLMRI